MKKKEERKKSERVRGGKREREERSKKHAASFERINGAATIIVSRVIAVLS